MLSLLIRPLEESLKLEEVLQEHLILMHKVEKKIIIFKKNFLSLKTKIFFNQKLNFFQFKLNFFSILNFLIKIKFFFIKKYIFVYSIKI